MIARKHYDDETLQQFLRSQQTGEFNEVETHLESCTDCQHRMEALSQRDLSCEELGKMLSAHDDGHHPTDQRDTQPDDLAPEGFLQPSDHPDSLGRFARYEIMELLGRGGMGIVMRGFDTSLNRHSAIKVLSPELASSAAARKRFSREAKSAAAVVHPHVVPIQTVDERNGLPYLVMPVVEGRSLQQRVTQDGPLEVIEAVRIATQIAEGLAAAHDQGLVHRDIKSANILLENGVERVQITDFGLARAADDASMTRSGVIAGTPQYMSPEQAHGDSIDHRSDLFSLGAVIYFMLTGHSPFRAGTTMGVLNRISNDAPRKLRTINPSVPAWLEAVVTRLLSKNPDDRFQSAREVGQLLAHSQARLQVSNDGTKSDGPEHPIMKTDSKSSHPPSRWSFRKFVIATAALMTAAFATIWVLETDKGTITIQAEHQVPIRILHGDTVVQQLTLKPGQRMTRVRSGQYVIEVDGEANEFNVVDGRVTIRRGDNKIVQIEKSSHERPSEPILEEPQNVRQIEVIPTNDDAAESKEAPLDRLKIWREDLKKAESRVEQTEESVVRWEGRIQLYIEHPSGRVNGVDIPNSSTIEDARESLTSVKNQLVELKRDRAFTHQRFLAMLASLADEQALLSRIAKRLSAELEKKRELHEQSLLTETELARAETAAEQASVTANKSQRNLQLYESVAAEFGMSSNLEVSGNTQVAIRVLSNGQFGLDGNKPFDSIEELFEHLDERKPPPQAIKIISDGQIPFSQLTELMTGLRKHATYQKAQLSVAVSKNSDADRVFGTSPEFPRVRIRVTDEEGKPHSGAKVDLFQSSGEPAKKSVQVSGATGGDGFAIDRILPFGHYDVRVNTDDGWSLNIKRLNVEFETGLEATIVAPTPNQLASIVVQSATNLAELPSLQELRFGELETHRAGSRSWSTSYCPEPDEELDDHETFPTILNGIDKSGIGLTIEVRRTIKQTLLGANNRVTTWRWYPTPDSPFQRRLLILDDHALSNEEGVYGGKSVHRRPSADSDIFKLSNHDEKIGALLWQLGDPHPFPFSVKIPAGDLRLFITGVYGVPNKTVMECLGWVDDSSPQQLWLEAKVRRQSKWIEQLIDPDGWTYSASGDGYDSLIGHLLRREHSLEPGEALKLSLGVESEVAFSESSVR